MSQQNDKIWESLKFYRVSEPKSGYIGRFWSRVSQKESFKEKFSRFFIPKPWAFVSLSFSVFLIVGVVGFQQLSNNWIVSDAEISNNLELAKHWQGIEHVDVLADLDVIEHSDFKVDNSI